MSLRIDGTDWAFQKIHGRQFLNGVEYKSLVHPENRSVTVTDTIPHGEQLEAAAKAALQIRRMKLFTGRAVASGWAAEGFDQKQAARRRSLGW
jgi:hypothetical protein